MEVEKTPIPTHSNIEATTNLNVKKTEAELPKTPVK